MAFVEGLDAVQGMIDYMLGQEGPYGLGSASTAEEVAEKYSTSIRGRVFMITGCTSGMGREVAFVLAKHGGIVVMASRSKEKLETTQAQIQSCYPHAVTHTLECDLGSLRSVQGAIRDYNRLNLPGLNVLICNAGIAFTRWIRAEEMGGVESQFAVNYLGHYALCKGLLSELVRAGTPGKPARIILVASVLHKVAYIPHGIRLHDLSGESYYEPIEAYGQSKLAMLLFMEELNKRIQERHLPVTVNALHPGPVNSSITRHFLGIPDLSGWQKWLVARVLGIRWIFTSPVYVAYTKLLGKSVPQGAATHVFLAASPDVKDISGTYWVDCRQEEYWHYVLDKNPKLGAELWDKSAKLTGTGDI